MANLTGPGVDQAGAIGGVTEPEGARPPTSQPWARDYIAKGGAIEVTDVDEVIKHLASPKRVRQATEQQQLTLALL